MKENYNLQHLELFRYDRGGGPRLQLRLVLVSCPYDPPIYDITSGCRVAALFSREAQRWTPDDIWFPRINLRVQWNSGRSKMADTMLSIVRCVLV